MTPSELKYNTRETAPYFFSRDTLRFFGDTMKNYGVCSNVVDTPTSENVQVWELYRKNPVKNGLQASAFFCKVTFSRIHKKI